MNLRSELHVGLKEWATVCAALARGRQIVLLRKGGIHEADGVFQLEHPQFLLFPTYLHQNAGMLKPEERGGLTAVSAEPNRITMSSAGVVTDILQVSAREQIDALDAEHVWTRPLIDMRFDYKPRNPLYLLLLRVYRLAEPVTVANTPEYAGCKSWVPLTQAVRTGGAEAVMGEADYQDRGERIRRVVQ